MKTDVFVLIIVLTVGVTAKELNSSLLFEGTQRQSESAKEQKTARNDGNSGKCGENISWVFNTTTSTLIISGQGINVMLYLIFFPMVNLFKYNTEY